MPITVRMTSSRFSLLLKFYQYGSFQTSDFLYPAVIHSVVLSTHVQNVKVILRNETRICKSCFSFRFYHHVRLQSRQIQCCNKTWRICAAEVSCDHHNWAHCVMFSRVVCCGHVRVDRWKMGLAAAVWRWLQRSECWAGLNFSRRSWATGGVTENVREAHVQFSHAFMYIYLF